MFDVPWRLERNYDEKNATHRLTNGRVQLSIWTGEVGDSDLEALEDQLKRGREAAIMEAELRSRDRSWAAAVVETVGPDTAAEIVERQLKLRERGYGRGP